MCCFIWAKIIEMRFNSLISSQFSSLIQTHSSSSSNLKALVQQGHYQEALKAYTKLPHFSILASKFTFPSLLKACASLQNTLYGKTLHSKTIQMGLHFDPYITSSLINMYIKCGSLSNAVELFDNMSQCEVLLQDVTLWNSIIDGLLKNGLFDGAVVRFQRMQVLNIKPDGYTLCILLGACNAISNFSNFEYGREIHGYVERNMFHSDPFVITALIDVYSSSNKPMYAWNVFEKLENKHSIAVWNAMINGFGKNRLWRDAFDLYSFMKYDGLELGSTSFSSVLTACSQGEDIDCGKQLHCDVIKVAFDSDPYVSTSLLTLYSKCGFIEDAEKLFHSIADKEVGVWNSMISAYINSERPRSGLDVYHKMRCTPITPDSFTVSNIFVACGMIGSFELGRMIHGDMWKRSPMKDNLAVESALLTMYSRLGRVEDAFRLFVVIKERDVITWGSMISGYCENQKFDEALSLFKTMISEGVEQDPSIIASVINACLGLNDAKLSCAIHGLVIKKGLESDAFTGSSLIELYAKHRQPEMAEKVFSHVSNKNLVVWNSLISCYSQNDLPEVSISLLPRVLEHGLTLDPVSITTVLAAVSSVPALVKGKAIHGYYLRLKIVEDIQVENALINMYLKCGCLRQAQHMFLSMSKRNLVTWNSMIAGYGSHGECRKAIDLFNEMRKSGTMPDEVTFLSLISSCNHAGYTDEGMDIFRSMRELGIEPKMEHYVNVVDLLGRAGRLDDAYGFVQNMAVEPERGVWLSLLSACRVHRNVELGELAGNKLLNLEPNRGSNYVQLLNLYAEGGLKEKAMKLRGLMRRKELTKVPGCSWIEVKDKIEVFYSGVSSSQSAVETYDTLYGLKSNMEKVRFYCENGDA